MKQTLKTMQAIDYPALAEQKLTLLRLTETLENQSVVTDILGVIHLIDSIQDAVIFDDIASESEVFPV